MDTLLFVLTAVLAVLNVVACVITFIWLIVLDQWWAIGYGFAAIPATVVLIVLAKPGQWMRLPAMALIDRKRAGMAYMCHLASRLFDALVISAWFACVLFVFSQRYSNFSFWPQVVWAYGLALAAWTYMSRHVRRSDTGDTGGDILMLFTQTAYLADAVLIVGFALRPPLRLMEVFAAIIFTGAIAASIAGFVLQKRQAELGTVYTRNPHA